MRKVSNILIIALLFFSSTAWAQENIFTLSGGYSFSKIDEADASASGWRINGLYEFNPSEGKWSHGLSVGYLTVKAEVENLQTVEYKLNSWPIYYAPKFYLGKSSFNGYAKGAIGMHFTNYKRTGGAAEVKLSNGGFYTGLGLGVEKTLGETTFLNLEYEWAWMSNTGDYSNGFMNSIMLGIGMRF